MWNVERFYSILLTAMIYRSNVHVLHSIWFIHVFSFFLRTQFQYVIIWIFSRYFRTKHYIYCKKICWGHLFFILFVDLKYCTYRRISSDIVARHMQSIGIFMFYTFSMIKYYKINTFGLICCRIISGVLFTHVHIKFDDGWWHILYSVYNEIQDIWHYKVMTWPDFFSEKSLPIVSI